MAKLWDTHMHTAFSGDCEIPPEVMLNRAKQLNLSGIIFTDHLDWDYPSDHPGEFDLEIEDYLLYMGKLLEIEANSHPTTELRIGIELGLQPHLATRHKD
ncbi:MAG: PHP domain-containing protein, partial [Lachnospiraceae bacterium]|nr:PHP domain-containing protein [Lachnospiraceae bacterium]